MNERIPLLLLIAVVSSCSGAHHLGCRAAQDEVQGGDADVRRPDAEEEAGREDDSDVAGPVDADPSDSEPDAEGPGADADAVTGGAIIVDHRSLNTAAIPAEWITAAQRNIRWHFTHTSHGDQIGHGLADYMTTHSSFAVSTALGSLPPATGTDALRIYSDRNSYWEYYYVSDTNGPERTMGILDANPTINLSGLCWCRDLDNPWFLSGPIYQYLEQLEAFETHYSPPRQSIRFVYFTGPSDAGGEAGYARYQANELIRAWVRDHPEENRILFDFADIESWRYDAAGAASDYSTYRHEGRDVPVRHPLYDDDTSIGHTNDLGRELKARAIWWMMARIAGWPGP